WASWCAAIATLPSCKSGVERPADFRRAASQPESDAQVHVVGQPLPDFEDPDVPFGILRPRRAVHREAYGAAIGEDQEPEQVMAAHLQQQAVERAFAIDVLELVLGSEVHVLPG